jgi:hypothetical protein
MPPDHPTLPSAIEALLRRAAGDESLRAALLAGPEAAAAQAGVELTPRERAILRAVPAAQLARMVDRMPPAVERREFLRETASAAVVLLGGAALGAAAGAPATAAATPPERSRPPAGIRPELPWFHGDVDLVNYRTVAGPARPLPDEVIERRLSAHSLRELPRTFAGTIGFTLTVDDRGQVGKVTPGPHPPERRAAVDAMRVDLGAQRFSFARAATTLAFDVALTPRGLSREWSGAVELVDLDVAGPDPDGLRRAVRGLVPKLRAAVAGATDRDRPSAGKVRYAFTVDGEGVVGEPHLTKNTCVLHHVAMSARQHLTDLRFPKAREPRWCRFSLVLLPAPRPR